MSESNRWSYRASTWPSIQFEGPLPLAQLEAELLPLHREMVGEWHRLEGANADLFVLGSWPRLWFGDLEAYARSRVRILTVSINPSGNDFRPYIKSKRNRLHNSCSVELARKCRAAFETDGCWSTTLEYAKRFFETGKPDQWFSGYRHVLRRVITDEMAGVDYNCADKWITRSFRRLPTSAGVALHTDICSPFATDKLWAALSKEERALLAKGPEYFGKLVEALRPNFILMSLAEKHWSDIFGDWPSETPISVRPWKRALLIAGGSAFNAPYRSWMRDKREALGTWMGFEASRRPLMAGKDDDYADLGHNSLPFFSEGDEGEEVIFDE